MAILKFGSSSFLFTRRFHKTIWKQLYRNDRAGSYYVLAPEVPPDTELTNPLLRHNDFPAWQEIDAYKCVSGCAKRAIEFEVAVSNLFNKLKNNRDGVTFSEIWEPIERHLAPLNHCIRTTKQMVSIHPSFKNAFYRSLTQVENAKNLRWLNKDLYKTLKHLKATKTAQMTEQERRLLHIYLLRSRFSGVDVANPDAFNSILFKIDQYKTEFRFRVAQAGALFEHVVDDFDVVAELPRQELVKLSLNQIEKTRGPWRLTLDSYPLVMSHCGDRLTRWNFWRAWNNRGSNLHPQKQLSNHSTIEELRNLRRDMAKYLKYHTFADLSMASKMAGGVETVVEFIDSLKQRFQPVSDNEFTRLQEFALSEGFGDKLEAWDVDYWRNRQLNHLYPLDMENLKSYFPLENVLKYAFNMYKALFRLSFQNCTSEVKVWDEDVFFFKILDEDSGEHLSSLYIQLYAQGAKGSTIGVGRDRSALLGQTPYSYLSLNLDRPTPPNKPLVSFQQLQNIFFQFGHVLQQLGTKAPHSETSGQNGVELDSINTIAIISKMILSTRQTLKFMSSHQHDQSSLSDEVIDTLIQRRHHMQSYDTMHSLFLSSYDLELHTSKDHWHSLMEKTWADFMPHSIGDSNNFPCSFTPIFADRMAAAFYSHKWSEMLACEIFKTFKQAKQSGNEEMLSVGKRFRDTYLSLGGSIGAAEVYRRFQGSDPSPEGLVGYYLRE